MTDKRLNEIEANFRETKYWFEEKDLAAELIAEVRRVHKRWDHTTCPACGNVERQAQREEDMKRERRFGYMCDTDFAHELGEAMGGTIVYSSIKDLKMHQSCWKECGIVRVEIKEVPASKKKVKP